MFKHAADWKYVLCVNLKCDDMSVLLQLHSNGQKNDCRFNLSDVVNTILLMLDLEYICYKESAGVTTEMNE